MTTPLLGPRIATLSALEFLAHIKTLIVHKETKASKACPDITLTWGDKRKILRINRENKKTLLLTEVEALAKEKDIETATLVEFMTSRKIRIEDENGLWINEWASKPIRRRRAGVDPSDTNSQTKTNARAPRRRKRKDILPNKLLEPERDSGMPTQSPAPAIQGPAE